MSLAIDQALIQSFIDGGFGLNIAHENLKYEPAAETAYAELVVGPNPKAPLTSNTDEATGVLRVILRYPENGGAIAAKTKAEEIMDHFKNLSEHTYSGTVVKITRSGRQPGFPEDGWYKLVLTFTYISFITRA